MKQSRQMIKIVRIVVTLGKARVWDQGEIWWGVTLLGPPQGSFCPVWCCLSQKNETKQRKALFSDERMERDELLFPADGGRGCYIRFSAVGGGRGWSSPRTAQRPAWGSRSQCWAAETLQTICCCHHLKEWCHTRSFCKCPLSWVSALPTLLWSAGCKAPACGPQWALKTRQSMVEKKKKG